MHATYRVHHAETQSELNSDYYNPVPTHGDSLHRYFDRAVYLDSIILQELNH